MENYAFGYDLIHFLKPKSIVELGVFCGGSYFVFAQAVKAAGIPTRCYAVDTWEGDSQAGKLDETAFNTFKAHHDSHCAEFSTILRMPFDQALARFENESIDLLHIDGFHSYEAVRNDYETWLPKVAKNGIILFHDVRVVNEAQNFGVKRFWEELRLGKIHFEMDNEFGLGVLFNGTNLPEGNEYLQTLFCGSPEEKQDFHHYYRLIKERILFQQLLSAYQNSHALIKHQEARIADLENKIRRKGWNA